MKLQTADFIFVIIQCILFFLFILDITTLKLELPIVIIYGGIALSVIGCIIVLIALLQLNKNLSPFPTPKSDSQLIQNGLYKYIRHPIYTGILVTFTGYSLYTSSGYKLSITLALYTLFFFKSKYEEKKLGTRFITYDDYIKRTGRFLPKINL